MDDTITPVSGWTTPNPQDAIAQVVRRDPRFAVKSFRFHRGELSPVTLYCYLKTRFGKPNGEMMAFRSKGSDNLVQWHYKLASNGFHLDVWGTNSGLQFIAHGTATVLESEWAKLFEQLANEFAACGSLMKDARAGLEKWAQFVNPFRRLENAVLLLERELKGIDVAPPRWPPPETDTKEYQDALGTFTDRASLARMTGFCLRMLAPIYAESFVNFVLYFFRNESLAQSDEKYRAIVRLPINERVIALASHCRGFPASLRDDAEEFRAFLRLMNGRNDLVHGNCDPTQLKVGDIFFDGTIPLWQQDGSTIVRLIQHSMRHVAKDDALKDVEVVRTFIRWVLASMDPGVARPLSLLMASEYPGLRSDTGRAGVLLPNTVVESFMGPPAE